MMKGMESSTAPPSVDNQTALALKSTAVKFNSEEAAAAAGRKKEKKMRGDAKESGTGEGDAPPLLPPPWCFELGGS